MSGESAIVLLVPEAEPVVGRWRERYDSSAALGIPAHVTLLFPWLDAPLTEDDERELSDVLRSQPSFPVTFSTTGRFSAVLYLQPDDDGPLLALMERLYEAFPDHPPYGGIHEDNVVPHLTIVDASREGDFEAIAAEVVADVHPRLPVTTEVQAVALLESDDEGMWGVRTAITLGG